MSDCKCCCKVFSDDFNGLEEDPIGDNWTQFQVGDHPCSDPDPTDWKLTGAGSLQNINYPAFISNSQYVDPVLIDVGGTPTSFPGAARLTCQWKPLGTQVPSIHRMWMGEKRSDDVASGGDCTTTVEIAGIFLQIEYGVRSPYNTVVMRLGSANSAGTVTWLTDELPIGSVTGILGLETPQPNEEFYQLSICWRPQDSYYYSVRGAIDVTAIAEAYTGTTYTLEATYPGSNAYLAMLEAVEGYARWDRVTLVSLEPDAERCPNCGQCLFAKDATRKNDLTAAAYSASGGTVFRNVTTGAIDVVGGTATWLVDVPAQNYFSCNYESDWISGSPTFSVTNGGVEVSISKVGGYQHVTVTVNGTPYEFDADLGSKSLIICFGHAQVFIRVGTGQSEYATTENEGSTSISLAAGSETVSVSDLLVRRTDSASVLTLDCRPCFSGEPPPECELCPDNPAAYAIVSASISTTFEDYDPGGPVGDLPAQSCFKMPSTVVAERGIPVGIFNGRCNFNYTDFCPNGGSYSIRQGFFSAMDSTGTQYRFYCIVAINWWPLSTLALVRYETPWYDKPVECPLSEYTLSPVSGSDLSQGPLFIYAEGSPASKIYMEFPATINLRFVL